jgi:uncharacterized membrane protein
MKRYKLIDYSICILFVISFFPVAHKILSKEVVLGLRVILVIVAIICILLNKYRPRQD